MTREGTFSSRCFFRWSDGCLPRTSRDTCLRLSVEVRMLLLPYVVSPEPLLCPFRSICGLRETRETLWRRLSWVRIPPARRPLVESPTIQHQSEHVFCDPSPDASSLHDSADFYGTPRRTRCMTSTISVRLSEKERRQLEKHGKISDVVREALRIYLRRKGSERIIWRLKELQRTKPLGSAVQDDLRNIRADRER
jgi:hypothetical protein